MSMRKTFLILATAALAGAFSAPMAHAAQSGAPGASLTACKTSNDAAKRSLTFRGVAAAYAPGQHVEIRFDLLQRIPGSGREQRIDGGGLHTWTRSGAGVTKYERFLTVQNLAAPATYRGAVRFRWIDETGKVVRSVVRFTRSCRQPDRRPDLRLTPLAVRRGDTSDVLRYGVFVRNAGTAPAGDFDLVLRVDSADQPAVTVAGLAPLTGRTVTVVAPRCAVGTVSVTVDPDNRIAESDETNNVLTVPCTRPGRN